MMEGYSILTFIYATLVVLNVFQFFFWGYQVQRLVDKLMSRNYHDYQASQIKYEPPRVIMPQAQDTGEFQTMNEYRPI